ncbi:inactive rhomboid protein 1-like, partial [Trifolium pratense]
MLSEVITNWTLHSNKVITLVQLLVISVANLVVGIFPHADNMVHIGGLLVGILAGFILLPHPQYGELEPRHIHAGVRQKSKYRAYQLLLGIISLVLLITGLSIALVTLFRGGNVHDYCKWCHYL